MKNYQELASIIESVGNDAQKFYEKGNSAAGTRLRKAMQDIKSKAQEVRVEVSSIKKS